MKDYFRPRLEFACFDETEITVLKNAIKRLNLTDRVFAGSIQNLSLDSEILGG